MIWRWKLGVPDIACTFLFWKPEVPDHSTVQFVPKPRLKVVSLDAESKIINTVFIENETETEIACFYES